jgi:hypothetical protein
MGSRRERLLAVLEAHPGGLACDTLLAAVAGPGERQPLLKALRALVAGGAIRITRQGTQIAGALVQQHRPWTDGRL